jgi:RimJ/RimL family protein N-acetyltransferase
MSYIPRLYTPRLCLRPFVLTDAHRVRQLAGDRRIAQFTARIPHPYPEGVAEAWIQSHQPAAAQGKAFDFAITLTGTRTPGREDHPGETGHVIGAIGLWLQGDPAHRRGELGYWMGVAYWNRGFVTEAARAVIDFGFSRRQLHRIVACHFGGNPASGRVLRKLGMTHEGVERSHFNKDGEFHDLVHFGILEEEWRRRRTPARHPATTPALETV